MKRLERPLHLSVHRSDGALLRTEVIDREIIKIGKLASCHLRIDDEQASRMHAVIEVAEEVSIIDLGSTAGTFVNGTRVNKAALRSGDRIQIGETMVVVTDPNSPVEQPPEAPLPPPAPRPDPWGCPRCKQALVPSGSARALLCQGCGGLWLGLATLRQVAQLPELAAEVRAIAEDAARRAPFGGINGHFNIHCPECGALMERRRHRRTGIVIDLCPAHGTWFDRGEVHRFLELPNASSGPFRTATTGEEPADLLPEHSAPAWMRTGDAPPERRLPVLLQVLDLLFELDPR